MVNDSATESENGRQVGVFATTQWSAIFLAGGDCSPAARDAIEQLCAIYWYPLYAYVRRQGHSVEDAQDLTQDFFARLLDRKYIRLANRNRGRFRTFLLTSLKHFLVNDWIKANRAKRGGGQKVLSLQGDIAELRYAAEPPAEQPPDTLYDRGWAALLLERAMTAMSIEFEQSGKRDLFERFKIFVWGEKNTLSYAEMAIQLGMTEGAVKVAVHRLRQRFGELLRSEVAQTVSTPAEVNDELRYLVSVIRDGLTNPGNVTFKKL